jgi:hypothetical protein
MASLHEQDDTEYRAEVIDELKQSLYPNHETTTQQIQHTSDQNEPEEGSKIKIYDHVDMMIVIVKIINEAVRIN